MERAERELRAVAIERAEGGGQVVAAMAPRASSMRRIWVRISDGAPTSEGGLLVRTVAAPRPGVHAGAAAARSRRGRDDDLSNLVRLGSPGRALAPARCE